MIREPAGPPPGEAPSAAAHGAPLLRRAGIAAALHRRFFRLAATHGARRVHCITSPGNATSPAFHPGLGFTVEPGDLLLDGVTVHADYDGPGLHRVVFTRTLTPTDSTPTGQPDPFTPPPAAATRPA